jgi:hypothetical protein
MAELEASLRGKVTRLDPRTRIATVRVPSVGQAKAFRADAAMPGEGLASVLEWGHTHNGGRAAGTVTAVRPRGGGAEVDVKVTTDSAWQRLASGSARIDVRAAFSNYGGLDPVGGRVRKVEID